MKKILQWAVILTTGWVTGWLSHDVWHSGQPADIATESPVAATAIVAASSKTTPLSKTDNPRKSANRQSSKSNELAVFRSLLETEQYQAAIQHYEAVYSRVGEVSSSSFRWLILHQVYDLQEAGSHQKAIHLINLYLAIYYRDVDALLILANSYHQQQQYIAEIETLYDALTQAYRTETLDSIKQRIHSAVALYTDQLEQQQNYQELLAFYQNLINIEADYGAYFLELAKAQMKLGHYQDALVSLEAILHDPVVGQQAQSLLRQVEERIALVSNGGIVIPLRRAGDHYLVKAKINDNTLLTLLLDTGASLSVIKSTTLQRLGFTDFDNGPSRILNTVNGPVRAPIITLESMALGDQRIENIQVGSVALNELSDIDGLLGMDYLKHFRFFIDQSKSILYLSQPDN